MTWKGSKKKVREMENFSSLHQQPVRRIRRMEKTGGLFSNGFMLNVFYRLTIFRCASELWREMNFHLCCRQNNLLLLFFALEILKTAKKWKSKATFCWKTKERIENIFTAALQHSLVLGRIHSFHLCTVEMVKKEDTLKGIKA